MITTISDLLTQLIEREQKKMAEFGIVNHGPMIGDMYEGLTRTVLDAALFDGLDLHIVDGKIRNPQAQLSRQIDCMLVRGEGQQLPHTDHYLYDADQVLAVVEVKKRLYGAEFESALALMRELRMEFCVPIVSDISAARTAWRLITATQLPRREDVDNLPLHEQMVYHSLIAESAVPLRIIMGYEGYASEHALRTGLLGTLENLVGTPDGGGPASLPSLVLCRDSALIKLNGMPFAARLSESGFWPLIASRSTNPIHTLLELIWTRLSWSFGLPSEVFGDDLEEETVNRLLSVKAAQGAGDQIGWEYLADDIPADELDTTPAQPWAPPVLTEPEFVVLSKLCKSDSERIDDPNLIKYLEECGETVDSFARGLQTKGLACVTNGALELLTDECLCAIDPELGPVAAENKSGRLTRWLLRDKQR